MEKFKHLRKIKDIYAEGGNLIKYLKSVGNNKSNSIEDILISYDFQSGTYIKRLAENPEYKYNYCGTLAKIIDQFPEVASIMEVGVGEATTLKVLIDSLAQKPKDILGFDISWSRLKFANDFLKDLGDENFNLFTANLFEIPLKDSSVDVVYTSHSIEPNGGKELEALKELYRITNKYLVLLEPSYELASEEARQRMSEHQYVTKLYATAKELGYKIIEHRLFDYSANPLNPTGLMIIEKQQTTISNNQNFICPITHTDLDRLDATLLYSADSFLAYPVIQEIPCLLKENAILASHLKTDYDTFKQENNIGFEKLKNK